VRDIPRSRNFPLQQVVAAGVTLREPLACLDSTKLVALVRATSDPQLYVDVARGFPDHFVSQHHATSRAALLRFAAKSENVILAMKSADAVFAALDGLAVKRAADWPQLDGLARWLRLLDDVNQGAYLANKAVMKSWPERAQLEAETEALFRAETAKANDSPNTLGEACWVWIGANPTLARGVHEGMAAAVVKLFRCDNYLAARRLFDNVTYTGMKVGDDNLAVDPLVQAARREADRCDQTGKPAMALWWRSGVAQWLLDAERSGLSKKHAVYNFFPRAEEIEATAKALAGLDAAMAGAGSPFARVGMYAVAAAALERIEHKQPFAKDYLRRAGSLALRAGYRFEATPFAQLAEAYAANSFGAAAAWTQWCADVGAMPTSRARSAKLSSRPERAAHNTKKRWNVTRSPTCSRSRTSRAR